jgi:hypothetical protein
MRTWKGREVDLKDFQPYMLDLEDVVRSLSLLCRFNGHSRFMFSVLEHSIIGCYLAETPQQKLEALLHDSGEAYVGDIILPLKEVFPEVCEFEDKITTMIFDKYWRGNGLTHTGIYKKSPYMIKLDRDMAQWESLVLRPHHQFTEKVWDTRKTWIDMYSRCKRAKNDYGLESEWFKLFEENKND